MTMTFTPSASSAGGSEPATSPSPPVFTKGAASAEAKTTPSFLVSDM